MSRDDAPLNAAGGSADHTRGSVSVVGDHRRASPEPFTVTALFDSLGDVDAVLDAMYAVGMPRDLIEVVVSHEAATRFPGRLTRGPGRETFRFAGIGGLTGLVVGAVISLVMVAWPGLDAPGGQAVAQLLGPNVGLVTGAAMGAVLGFFRHRRPDPRHARAGDAAAAIVVAVATRSEAEGLVIARLLTDGGGREARLESRS